MIDPSGTLQMGTNVVINDSGSDSGLVGFLGTVIEAGANALLDYCGAGEVIHSMTVLYDISVAAAGTDYDHAHADISPAGTQTDTATGFSDCRGYAPPIDGSYGNLHLPFDASWADGVRWQFLDDFSQNHTITISAQATYENAYGEGSTVSTSVNLGMYLGANYLEVHSAIKDSGNGVEFSGDTCWINGSTYSTPLPELILLPGNINVTVPSTLQIANTNCTFYGWAGDAQGDHSCQWVDTSFTADKNVMAIYNILGDINRGPDGKPVPDGAVDIYDAILIAVAWNSSSTSRNWYSAADLNGDGTVDIFDAIILAGNFGKLASSVVGAAGRRVGSQSQGGPLSAMPMDAGDPAFQQVRAKSRFSGTRFLM